MCKPDVQTAIDVHGRWMTLEASAITNAVAKTVVEPELQSLFLSWIRHGYLRWSVPLQRLNLTLRNRRVDATGVGEVRSPKRKIFCKYEGNCIVVLRNGKSFANMGAIV